MSNNLKSDLDAFAASLAKDAQGKDTPLEVKVDVFKALTAFYALELKRLKGQPEEEDDGEPTMEALAQTLNGERHGRTATRLRDR